MKGIVIASHGKMAEGLLDTLQLFCGELVQVEAVCLEPGEDLASFSLKLKKAFDKVETGDGTYMFCDLLFGTPCNTVSSFLNIPEYKDKIEVITGMNLPMLLEYTNSRAYNTCGNKEDLINIGKDGIVDFNKLLEERKKDV